MQYAIASRSVRLKLGKEVPLRRKVKSAERTLALLELFSREQTPFTVGLISKKLAIPQPSASMLLQNMFELGYLEFDREARTYSPSIRVAMLGAWIDRRFGETGAIGERLGELQRLSGESACIGIQNGAAIQYVLAQTPQNPEHLDIQSGQYRSLTQSAVGQALLSLKNDREVLQWVRRCNAEAKDERGRVHEARYLELIDRVRKRGYAETRGEIRQGFGAIATTFRSPMGASPLAVAIGGSISHMEERREEFAAALFDFRAFFGSPGRRTRRHSAERATPV